MWIKKHCFEIVLGVILLSMTIAFVTFIDQDAAQHLRQADLCCTSGDTKSCFLQAKDSSASESHRLEREYKKATGNDLPMVLTFTVTEHRSDNQ